MISYLIIFFSLLIILFPKKEEIKGDLYYSLIFFSLSFSQVIIGFISLVLILLGISKFPILIIASLIFLITYIRNKQAMNCLKKTQVFMFNEIKQLISKAENSNHQKIIFFICFLLLIAILISSVGPINHPDAADYHVGYPFQYFSRGKFFVDGGLHQGLLGIGDYANLAFIQENTNWFIRFVQIINLPLLFIFFAKKFKNNFYLLTFLSVPTIIQWSTIGKPLFLGEASLIVIYLIWRENNDTFSLKLLLISIVNCISVKISSILVITPVFFDLMIYFFQNYRLNKELLKTIKDSLCSREFLLTNLILLTLLFNRYLITGNFIYPLLTNIFNKGDELVINFSNLLQNYQRQELFIIRLFIPTKLSNIAESLGLSLLLMIFGISIYSIKNYRLKNNKLFFISISQILILFLFCQGRADYYIMPLILIIYQYEIFEISLLKLNLKYLFYLVVIFQFILINIFLSISIFYNLEAVFSYDNFMKRTAYGYSFSKLVDKSFPGKTFINDRNTRLYYSFDYLEKDKFNRCIKDKNPALGKKAEEICLEENNVNQIISSKSSENYKYLYECKSIDSFKATRNFLKRKINIVNYCKKKI